MEAIVLTDEQAAALRAANEGSALTLEPRRLEDGRVVLNADVLDDPYFADPRRGWAAVLLAPPEANNAEPEITEERELSPEIDVESGSIDTPVFVAAGIQRVVLSETELI